jgi:hypothetical protein
MNYKEQFDRDGYVVIDNFIDLFDQETIKHTLFGVSFPYYFVSDIIWNEGTLDENIRNPKKYPGLFHVFVVEGNINSSLFIEPIQRIVSKGSEVVGSKHKDILFSRSFLTFPLNDQFDITGKKLHIDEALPHLVVLYYVVDADGDTILTHIKGNGVDRDLNMFMNSEDDIKARVTPKQGRVLIFDGMHYHCVTPPKNGVRSIINTILL